MIDYKELLKKYMAVVRHGEKYDYTARNDIDAAGVDISREELAILKDISEGLKQ